MNSMHPYATDSKERVTVPLLIAAASILSAWGLHHGLQLAGLAAPWWIDAPSVMGFYSLFHRAFDKYLWRVGWLRKVGLVRLPILAGIWHGHTTSSFDNHAAKHPVTVEVRQSWRQMSIVLRADKSISYSLVAAILTEAPGGMVLSYEYRNEPAAAAVDTMNIHYGTNHLTISPDVRTLEGQYYTGRGRSTVGHLSLTRPAPHD